MNSTISAPCPLCEDDGEVLWRGNALRVIDACAPDHPGYTRVIWNAHVAEMTQLPTAARDRLMRVVWTVEQALRDTLAPDKINLAEFGNQVPHLHWHVIPRWRSDTHFPDAIWAAPITGSDERQTRWATLRSQLLNRLPTYHDALRRALDALTKT
ncbi:MAG TPA: HIT family protein [Burkholderiaceae bacterium]|nr:HIT family protein [Burkholderiaceae bacterium]